MSKRLLLLLNPFAGQKRANRYLPDIIRLYNDRGYECVVYVTAGPGDATLYLQEHGTEFDHVVCIGGDGTLNETIAGIVESGDDCPPVGYIPAGTTNDYANSLGLSHDILTAAVDAVDGWLCRFDLGSFNGRNFIYTASCGAFARTSFTTPQTAKNLLGHLAYILEGLRDLPTLKPIHAWVNTEDRMLEGDYIFIGVTNSLSVGGIVKLDPDLVRLNDGLFEVMLVKFPMVPGRLAEIIRALTTNDMPSEEIEFFTAERVHIETEDMVQWTLDGERGDSGRSFDIVNLYNRFPMILPERSMDTVPVEAVSDDEQDQLSD